MPAEMVRSILLFSQFKDTGPFVNCVTTGFFFFFLKEYVPEEKVIETLF